MHKLSDQKSISALPSRPFAIILVSHLWAGRAGLTETMETLDILAEEGIKYVADWPLDDQPLELKVNAGEMYSDPVSVETNDITMMALHHHSSEEFATKCVNHFDRLYEESADITRIMGISMHIFLAFLIAPNMWSRFTNISHPNLMS